MPVVTEEQQNPRKPARSRWVALLLALCLLPCALLAVPNFHDIEINWRGHDFHAWSGRLLGVGSLESGIHYNRVNYVAENPYYGNTLYLRIGDWLYVITYR